MLLKLELPPGLYKQGTEYSSMGRWYDASLVRWFEGQIRPMKGWATGLTGTLSGNTRAAHAFFDNDGSGWAAFATHTNLYAHDGTTLDTITPAGFASGHADTSQWTLDNFGEILIACNDSTEKIYEYTLDGGGDATIISNAPDANAVFVTEERIIVAIAADGNPRKVKWSDQEARTTWTATATNQAGDLNLTTNGIGMCGGRIRGGGLIWTTDDLHLMRYLGQPDIYGIERVGNNCGIVGRHAFIIVDSVAYWMGYNSFFRYAGYVEPLSCDISDDVFTNLNTTYRDKVWCLHNAQFGEVWFFYPRSTSERLIEDGEDRLLESGEPLLLEGGGSECSHAAIFNYREGTWYHTPMARLAGFQEGVFDWPVMVNSSGAMLKHETGWTYDTGSVRKAVSGPVELGDGEHRLQIDEFIPDELTQGDCEVRFFTRDTPNSTETTLGPYDAADRVGVITTARQARMAIRAESATEDFRIGTYRVNVRRRGRY